jgi:hypothetical protein
MRIFAKLEKRLFPNLTCPESQAPAAGSCQGKEMGRGGGPAETEKPGEKQLLIRSKEALDEAQQ